MASIAWLFFFCALLSASLSLYAWRHRTTYGVPTFIVFTLAVAVYSAGYAMELSSPNLATALFWSKVQYAGILVFPTSYLVFVVQYIGRGAWLTRRNLGLLFVLPAFIFIIKLFDQQLGWIYASASAQIENGALLLSFERGPAYLLVSIYHLTVVTIANILLLNKWRSTAILARTQTSLLLLAAIIPYATYVSYLLGLSAAWLPGIDVNPISYAVWCVVIGFAIFQYRLLDLAPIARDALIETLTDGVVVLDAQGRLVDANPRARQIFGWSQASIGEPASRLLGARLQGNFETLAVPGQQEFAMHEGQDSSYYDVSFTTLNQRGALKLGYLMVVHDISELKFAQQELRELSLKDELTGLHNRRGFHVLADQLLAMASRMQLNAVLFYIDVDRLKWINDTLGHAEGDRVLQDVAAILRSSFRTSDVIARLGGDEFVVFALESSGVSGTAMLARLQENLDQANRLGHPYKLSLSAGLATYEWQHPQPLDALMKQADQAMYVVKQAKKN